MISLFSKKKKDKPQYFLCEVTGFGQGQYGRFAYLRILPESPNFLDGMQEELKTIQSEMPYINEEFREELESRRIGQVLYKEKYSITVSIEDEKVWFERQKPTIHTEVWVWGVMLMRNDMWRAFAACLHREGETTEPARNEMKAKA